MSAQLAPGRISYDPKGAAEAVDVSESTIRRAMRATDPKTYPPPLKVAGRHGPRGAYILLASDLEAWLRSCERFL